MELAEIGMMASKRWGDCLRQDHCQQPHHQLERQRGNVKTGSDAFKCLEGVPNIPRYRAAPRPRVGRQLAALKTGTGLKEKHSTRFAGASASQNARYGGDATSQDSQDLRQLFADGPLDDALCAIQLINHRDSVASVVTYELLLRRCSKLKSLAKAEQLHAIIAEIGLESHICLGNLAVSMFVQCGSVDHARQVFNKLESRNVFSWTALISGYVEEGQVQEAVRMYREMRAEGVSPNSYTYVSMLKACTSLADLEEGRRIHAEVRRTRCELNLFVATSLVSMYAKCGSMEGARDVFDRLVQRNLVLWNAIIAGYAQQGLGENALQLYEQMQDEGVQPDNWTFVAALKACSSLAAAEEASLVNGLWLKMKAWNTGKVVHSKALQSGFVSDVFIANTLVHMFATCGSIREARHVFDMLENRNLVSWNAIIAGYAQQEDGAQALELYSKMLDHRVRPDKWTFVSVLKACATLADKEKEMVLGAQLLRVESLWKGLHLHFEITRLGYGSDPYVQNTLVHMYARCGDTNSAKQVFDRLSQHDVVSWNALIAGFCEQGEGNKVLQLYMEMQSKGVQPNKRTLVSVLKACAGLQYIEDKTAFNGQQLDLHLAQRMIRRDVVRLGIEDVHVGTALVYMCVKAGSVTDARYVFDRLKQRNVVTWNALIAAYAHEEQSEKCLQLYAQMQREGLQPNNRTFLSLLKACGTVAAKVHQTFVYGQLKELEPVTVLRVIQSEVVKWGCDSDLLVKHSLLLAFSRAGNMLEAQHIFDGWTCSGVVLWSALISGYAQQGLNEKALQLFAQMQEEGVKPDEVAFLCILKVCSSLGSLEVCKHIHRQIGRAGIGWSIAVPNALIHAYGNCGGIMDAQHVFNLLHDPDLVSWTALIAAYTRIGDCRMTLEYFEQMQQTGLKPDAAVFVAVLNACSHAGWVAEGLQYFESMVTEHAISAKVQHYAALVDLLGRAGLFALAEDLLASMPMEPDLAIWLSLLGASRKYSNLEVGRRAFNHAVTLAPSESAPYVLMSQVYDSSRMHEHAGRLRDSRQAAAAWKQPGESWIQHEDRVHRFGVGKGSHEQSTEALHAKELSAVV